MSTIPNTPVLGKVFANNGKAKRNQGITEHKKFSMAHPQKLIQSGLNQLLEQFNLSNPDKQSNGMMRGSTLDGGSYFMTPGVIKFTKGNKQQAYPQPSQGNDAGPQAYSPSMNPAADTMSSYSA
jgi:hypothetical protein